MESDAYEWGRRAGLVVGICLPLIFLILAFKRFGQPNNNRKCALSLMLVMGGWLLCSLAYALATALGFAGAVALIMMIAGAVFAVVGLIDVSTRPAGQVQTGRGQAIGALVVAAIVLAAGFIGFVSGFGESLPKGWKLAQSPPGTKLSFAPKNFTFVAPEKKWVQVDPKKLNPLADVAFALPKERTFFMVIAHTLQPGQSVTPERLAEASRAEVRQMDGGAQIGETRPETAGALTGLSFTADARPQGTALTYRFWVYAGESHFYQLVGWGPRSSRERVIADVSALCRNFALGSP